MAVKWVWVCQRQAYYFYLLGSKNCSGLQPQSRTKELDFLRFPLSLHDWIYAVQTDMISRNIYFTLISLLSASIAAALRRPGGLGQSPIIPHIIPRKNYSSANFATVSVICPLSSVFPGCMTSPASLRLRWSGNDESETESPVFMRF